MKLFNVKNKSNTYDRNYFMNFVIMSASQVNCTVNPAQPNGAFNNKGCSPRFIPARQIDGTRFVTSRSMRSVYNTRRAMFTAPDKNFKASRYPDKTIFESLVDPGGSIVPLLEASHPYDPRFQGSLAFSAYRPLCGHPRREKERPPFRERLRFEKKLTFKPAIKTKNAKSLILEVAPCPPTRRGGDSWSMRITLAATLFLLYRKPSTFVLRHHFEIRLCI